MSDSLMAFQPEIDEPSNITPSVNVSSSVAEAMRAVCCHLPRGSVKRKSTNFTSFSFIIARTALASIPIVLLSLVTLPPRAFFSYGGVAALASTNSYRVLDTRHKDFAVADAAGVSRGANGLDGLFDHLVLDDQLDLHLGQEIHDIFGAAVKLGMAFLAAEALGLEHGDALEADLIERVLHFIQLEGLDDRFDLLHLPAILQTPPSALSVKTARAFQRGSTIYAIDFYGKDSGKWTKTVCKLIDS